MQSDSTTQNEHEEINLDYPSGWIKFFDYAKDVYAELNNLPQKNIDNEETEKLLVTANRTYEQLRTLVTSCTDKLEKGSKVDLNDSDEAQELYDKLLDLRDRIELLATTKKESDSVSLTESENTETTTIIANQKNEIAASSKKEETEDSLSLRMNEIYELLVDLATKTEEQLAIYKQRLGSLDKDKASGGWQVVKQIEVTYARINNLKEQLEGGTIELSEDSVSTSERSLIEIEKNLDEFHKAYKTFYGVVNTGVSAGGMQSKNAMDIISDVEAAKPLAISVIEKKVVEPPRKESLSSLSSNNKKTVQSFIVPKHLLANPHLNEILSEAETTWQEVDRNLKKTIIEVEKPSQLDVFLRVKQGSVYKDLLAAMTIEELSAFERRTREEIIQDLVKLQKQKGQQYEYRVYRAWLDMFDDMAAVTPIHRKTTFAELCTLFEIVKLLPEDDVEEM
jgi:hypothetical protein